MQITTPKTEHKAIGVWLLTCAALVLFMVILGGLTRLTHSGLSMVEWQLTTILPPMTQDEWVVMFEKYRQFPEFQKVSTDMDVEGFKSIFWLEFIHRNVGRLIGFVFLLPFVGFLAKGWVSRKLGVQLAGLFLLGGAQGGMGWYMVASGLVDNPDVSQYRLTAHLMLATFILAGLVWVGLGQLGLSVNAGPSAARRRLSKLSLGLLVLIMITIASGGFVAGTDAGFTFNTFPLMDGRLVPEGYLPALSGVFEDVATIQFNHRLLATSTVVLCFALWSFMRGDDLPARTRLSLHALALMAAVQLSLGISTLLLVVPVHLASAHQAGALVLMSLTIWVLWESRSAKS